MLNFCYFSGVQTKPWLKFGILWAIGVLCNGCSSITKTELNLVELGRSIVQIQAVSAGGKQNMGSGVVIAANTVATNCHVTRAATRIYLIKEDQLYPVLAQSANPEYDVCILKTDGLDLPIAKLENAQTETQLERVLMFGYPFGLNLRSMPGNIIAFHPYAGANLIEVSTGFNFGASGGGVFNRRGELLGLMTFIGRNNGKMRFYVVPTVWLESVLELDPQPLQVFSDLSFWEKGDFLAKVR